MNQTEAFEKFDDALKLNPADRGRAEKCHNEITLLLKAKGLIIGAFLQGSLARKTMIPPLRDVDKVVILAEALRGLTPDDVMDRLQAVLANVYRTRRLSERVTRSSSTSAKTRSASTSCPRGRRQRTMTMYSLPIARRVSGSARTRES